MRTTRTARHWEPWLLAGVLSGMAILTRATGLILLGVVGLALTIRAFKEISTGRSVVSSVKTAMSFGSVWLFSTTATIFLLLPALWVAPAETVQALWSWSSNAATEGHENPTFFKGIHFDDPGLTVYPVVLLWRTSPVEWIGILLLLILGYRGWKHRSGLTSRGVALIAVMIVFALVYVAAMSAGAKKFDRYILPVFPVIALVAASGLLQGRAWINNRGGRVWTIISYVALSILLVAQVASWNGTRPYRMDYYSPILGGAKQAEQVLQMGWGQGGDEVARFLTRQTDAGAITVQTSAVPSAFTYFLPDDSPIHFENFGLDTPAGWYETDFYVAGIQQFQRNLAPWYEFLEPHRPAYTVEIGGVAYFSIYDVRNLPLPEKLKVPTSCNYTFGDEVTLMQVIGREETIDFYFLSSDTALPSTIEFSIEISALDGSQSRELVELIPKAPGRMNRVSIAYQSNDGSLSDATAIITASSNTVALPVSAPWQTNSTTSATLATECYYEGSP